MQQVLDEQPVKRATRDRILEVAQGAVLDKGLDATTIKEIAAAVKISRAGLFCHFPDRNALARALIERHIEEEAAWTDGLLGRAAIRAASSPAQPIRTACSTPR